MGDRATVLVSSTRRADVRMMWSMREAGSCGPRSATRMMTLNVPSHARNKVVLHQRMVEKKVKGAAAKYASTGSSIEPPCFGELHADPRGRERGASFRRGLQI